MTNKEKQYIKELGQLYVRTGEKFMGCGSGYEYTYKPVDVIEYIEQQEYNENLNTYMKYRNAQRYSAQSTCYGGVYYDKSSNGDYVVDERGKYLNIKNLESKLKPEDIEKRVNKLKSVKYKDYLKFSKIQMNGSDTFAYVEDSNGHFVYDNNAHKFIDITE
jgi:hypothetical protein